MSYSIYGNKFVVFQIIYVVGIWMVTKFDLDSFLNNIMTVIMIVISILSMFVEKTMFGLWGIALLYRLLFIPAEAHFFYFDFFQYHPYLYLSQGILKNIIEDPYDHMVSVIIGSSFDYNYTGAYNNLNNGLFSDAYANFGLLGVIVFPVILGTVILIYYRSMRMFTPAFRYAILPQCNGHHFTRTTSKGSNFIIVQFRFFCIQLYNFSSEARTTSPLMPPAKGNTAHPVQCLVNT